MLMEKLEFGNAEKKPFKEKEEEFDVAGGRAKVIEIEPDEPKTDIPVFVAPAWACTTEVYRPVLEELALQKRRAISIDHPRIGGDLSSAPKEAIDKYSPEILRRALNIVEALDQKKIEKTDAIAHSIGAVDTVVAAMLRPEKFRNIVFYGAAGLIGKDTFPRLLKGQGKRAETMKAIPENKEKGIPGLPEIPISETEKKVAAKAATEALKYFAKNPIRALKEAMALTNEKSQIEKMLGYLHNEKGIGIVIMHAVDDPVFDQNMVRKMLKDDMIDGYLSMRGGHGEIGNHPELYVVAADQMFAALEKKKLKKLEERGLIKRMHPRT